MHQYDILEKGITPERAGHAIIALHGRGGSAEDILTLAEAFADETSYLAAPRATHQTWYPLGFMADIRDNEPWLTSAVDLVKRLIDTTSLHIPVEKIYLMGFSQGACLTLEVAARFAQRYAGVAAFTGGLIGQVIDPTRYAGDFGGTPIFIGNSDRDPHVPEERSAASAELLRQMGADVRYRVYPDMPHMVIEDEINEVRSLMF